MPHISRRYVRRKIYKKMNENLMNVFAHFRSKAEVVRALNTILTPTEKVMFAKRLAIVLMLQNGYSFRAIERTVKVTPQTVLRFWKIYKAGKFDYLKQRYDIS